MKLKQPNGLDIFRENMNSNWKQMPFADGKELLDSSSNHVHFLLDKEAFSVNKIVHINSNTEHMRENVNFIKAHLFNRTDGNISCVIRTHFKLKYI